MAMSTKTLMRLSAAGGLFVVLAHAAQAQPKQGCEDATPRDTAMQAEATESGSTAPDTGVGGPELTAEQRAAMDGSTGGSVAPMPGMGECDDIDELPLANSES